MSDTKVSYSTAAMDIAMDEIAMLKQKVRDINEEMLSLYRELAGAKLSARIGWQRYWAANKAHLSLQDKFAQKWDEKGTKNV